jgi:hypothetical protein
MRSKHFEKIMFANENALVFGRKKYSYAQGIKQTKIDVGFYA